MLSKIICNYWNFINNYLINFGKSTVDTLNGMKIAKNFVLPRILCGDILRKLGMGTHFTWCATNPLISKCFAASEWCQNSKSLLSHWEWIKLHFVCWLLNVTVHHRYCGLSTVMINRLTQRYKCFFYCNFLGSRFFGWKMMEASQLYLVNDSLWWNKVYTSNLLLQFLWVSVTEGAHLLFGNKPFYFQKISGIAKSGLLFRLTI